MADKSGIEWTDATWSVLSGCEWASPGCDGCYAARDAAGRLSHMPAYQGLTVRGPDGRPRFTGEVRTHPDKLGQPLAWARPRRVFVASQSDLFHPRVPTEYLADVFAVMSLASWHTFQVLTKRPARMAALSRSDVFQDMVAVARARRMAFMSEKELAALGRRQGGTLFESAARWPLANVWMGTSVESDEFLWRLNQLADTDAAVRWLSVEPLIAWDGPGIMDLAIMLRRAQIGWVVVGGESGPKSRPMHPHWARVWRRATHDAGAAFLFKQWGEWAPASSVAERETNGHTWEGDTSGQELMLRVGRTLAGRELDGRTWDEYPRTGGS